MGKTLLVDGAPYLVIGVMKPKLQMGNYAGLENDHAVIPITTYVGQYSRQRLNNLVLKVQRPRGHARGRSSSSRRPWGPSTGSTPKTRRSSGSGTR